MDKGGKRGGGLKWTDFVTLNCIYRCASIDKPQNYGGSDQSGSNRIRTHIVIDTKHNADNERGELKQKTYILLQNADTNWIQTMSAQ